MIVRYSRWEVKVWYDPKTGHTISCGKLVRPGRQGFAAPVHNGWEERHAPGKVADSPFLIKAPVARGVVHGLWTVCGRREISGVSRADTIGIRHPAMRPLHGRGAEIASARNAPCPLGRLHEWWNRLSLATDAIQRQWNDGNGHGLANDHPARLHLVERRHALHPALHAPQGCPRGQGRAGQRLLPHARRRAPLGHLQRPGGGLAHSTGVAWLDSPARGHTADA